MRDQIDRKNTFMRCWSFMVPVLFFSIVTDSVYMSVIGLTAITLLLIRKKPVELTLRTGIYGAVIALTVTILANTIFEIENRFFMSPAELAVPASLIFAMTLSFFDSRPTFTASVLIMCIFALMMCGDINQSHIFRNLPLPDYLGTLDGIQNMYIFCLILCAVPFYFLMNRSHFNIKSASPSNYKSLIIKFVLILVSFAMVTAIYSPTLSVIIPFSKKAERSLSNLLSQFRNQSQKKRAFDKNVNLRNSFFNEGQNLDEILIGVSASEEPGYLRSRTYENYHDGSWKSTYEPETMVLLTEDHEYTHSSFSFRGNKNLADKKNLEKINIFYSGNFEVSTILHSGKSVFIEMTCESLDQTPSATVTGKDVDYSGGITLYNEKNRGTEVPYPGPYVMNEEVRGVFLQIDDREDYGLKKQLLESFKYIITDSSSADAIALSIQKYFHEAFEYKLGTSVKGTSDPIITFLKNGEGHCELFATTTVMALRAHGIPARYVTGFYCAEKHPYLDYYFGRAKDLHAWVEYYDDESAAWKHLEPTPAGAMPSSKSGFNWFSSMWQSLVIRWNELMSSIVRGYFAEAVLLFLKSILDVFIWCFSAPLRALISLSIIFFFFYRRRGRRTKEAFSKEFVQLKKDFDKMINRINKLKDFKISESTTVSEIATQIERLNSPGAMKYANCLKEYEKLRYCNAMRTAEQITRVKSSFTEALKTRIR